MESTGCLFAGGNEYGQEQNDAVNDLLHALRKAHCSQKAVQNDDDKAAGNGADVTAAAAYQRNAADGNGRNRGHLVGIAHAEVELAELAAVQHAGQSGHHAAECIGAELDLLDGNTGKQRDLLTGADAVQFAAVRCFDQQDPCGRRDQHPQKEQGRNAADVAHGQIFDDLRDAAAWGAAGETDQQALIDDVGGHSHDDRSNADVGDAEAVDRAHQGAGQQDDGNGVDQPDVFAAGEHGAQVTADAEDPRNRKIHAASQDGKSLSQCGKAQHGDGNGQDFQVCCIGVARFYNGNKGQQGSSNDKGKNDGRVLLPEFFRSHQPMPSLRLRSTVP